MENNQWLCESESDLYHWLSLDGLKSIISMKPYEHILSEQLRTKKKSQFLIDNKQHLCEHDFLHPMSEWKGKYIPDNLYTSMKDTFNTNLQSKSVLGFHSSYTLSGIYLPFRAVIGCKPPCSHKCCFLLIKR